MLNELKGVSFVDFLPNSNSLYSGNITKLFTNIEQKAISQAEAEIEYIDSVIEEDLPAIGFGKISRQAERVGLSEDNKGNEIIDPTYQQGTGDCWLLAGVNALSYTKQGAEAIKDVIEYKEDGSAVVHFKGGYGDYVITKEEIANRDQRYPNGHLKYAVGDVDMNVIEIAVEKALNDIGDGKIIVTDENDKSYYEDPSSINDKRRAGYSSLEGGMCTQVMNMLTGKDAELVIEKDAIQESLDKYNGKDMALACCFNTDPVEGKDDTYYEYKEVEDINGNKINLVGCHAYAIKNANDDTVTITNPWDSGEDIVLSRETFMNSVRRLESCDMTDANEDEAPAKRVDNSDDDDTPNIDKWRFKILDFIAKYSAA